MTCGRLYADRHHGVPRAMEILEYAAFATEPGGGNPAGVLLDAAGLTENEMQSAAAELGYSETAFLHQTGPRAAGVRYFSPRCEVPFCGHATIAASVAFAQRHGAGRLTLDTRAGPVEVVIDSRDGLFEATLTTVEPRTVDLDDEGLDLILAALRWTREVLDPGLPPRVAYAGAWHPVIGIRTRAQLARLDYDFDALAAVMARHGWTTVNLLWRESSTSFYSRNPFPPGGVVEDPATGAAAGAFGGYLRELGLVAAPATITVHQGDDLGRPGLLTVSIPPSGGIRVTGTAVAI